MKVCIQHSATRKFLCEAATWVDNVETALKFTTSIDAFRHCVEVGLSNVYILVDRGQSRPMIVIPVETPQLSHQTTTGFPRRGRN